jgi:thioredoxin
MDIGSGMTGLSPTIGSGEIVHCCAEGTDGGFQDDAKGSTSMASANVMEFTDSNFENEVLGADKPVLVDFWAEWCMPCKILAPTIDDVANEHTGKVKVGKVDTDANREISVKYGISAIPTVIIFKGGEVAKKFVGLTKKEDIDAALAELS